LIVEDNPKSLKLVRDTLQAKGYQTFEAETGEEGARRTRATAGTDLALLSRRRSSCAYAD